MGACPSSPAAQRGHLPLGVSLDPQAADSSRSSPCRQQERWERLGPCGDRGGGGKGDGGGWTGAPPVALSLRVARKVLDHPDRSGTRHSRRGSSPEGSPGRSSRSHSCRGYGASRARTTHYLTGYLRAIPSRNRTIVNVSIAPALVAARQGLVDRGDLPRCSKWPKRPRRRPKAERHASWCARALPWARGRLY